MSTPIRVLLADDAVVVRRLLTDILDADPEIEVVGAAPNGRLALAKLAQVNPDVVILDVEMPEMDGLETLAALRKTHPRLPVIMFSTLTERGAQTTLDALNLGATDYVTKPSNSGSLLLARQKVADDLLPRIKHLGRRFRPRTAGAPAAAPAPKPAAPPRRPRPTADVVEVVAIGVSTGGPNALAELLPVLPGDLPAPVLIVQHMPPVFTRLLAERLDKRCALEVVEAQHGMRVKSGHVYIAPGDFHMVAARQGTEVVVHLNQGPAEQSCRPAVDPLFRSVADVWGAHALAVVLTGMGSDGSRGASSIHAAGGHVLVQDEASSVVWGMPGAVVQAGLADEVLPLDHLGASIVARALRAARLGS